MSASDRDVLLREAGGLKLRGMRLRAFGTESERWEAVVLLREAAQKEIEALALLSDPSVEEQTGARVEACGLLLEAGDPVGAVRVWAQMPPTAFSSELGAALLGEVGVALEARAEAFCGAWSTLRGQMGTSGGPQVPAERVRSTLQIFPGVAELWWALALNTEAAEDAAEARARALQLDPSLADLNTAIAAWNRVDETFAREMQLELKAERPQEVLTLDPVGRIVTAAGALISDFLERLGAVSLLVPSSAKSGSFIVGVTARGVTSDAIAHLDRQLNDATDLDARVLHRLLALLQADGVRLAVSVRPIPRQIEQRSAPLLVIDAERRKAVAARVEAALQRRVESGDVPQANELRRVFQVAVLVADHKDVDAQSLGGITPRQVSYYRNAAKILGLLTDSDELTASGRLITRLDDEERLRASVVLFESSVCGDAWIQWSGGKTLLDVEEGSATRFLQATVSGLNNETITRRAATLRAWHRLLGPYHYSAGQESRTAQQLPLLGNVDKPGSFKGNTGSGARGRSKRSR